MDPGLGLGISITPVFGLAKQWFASNGLQAMVCKQVANCELRARSWKKRNVSPWTTVIVFVMV
jgi:hypothetical protein